MVQDSECLYLKQEISSGVFIIVILILRQIKMFIHFFTLKV